MNKTLEIKPGLYRTRDGSKAEAYADDLTGIYPVLGCVHTSSGKLSVAWMRNGQANRNAENNWDLVSPWTEPESIQWTREDVRPGMWFRRIGGDAVNPIHQACVVITDDGIGFAERPGVIHSWVYLAKHYEVTTDLREWHPCTKKP